MSGPSNDQDHPEPDPYPVADDPDTSTVPAEPAAEGPVEPVPHVHYDDDGNVIAEH